MHEARGLDVLPQTIRRFRSNGDAQTADLLEGVVYPVRLRIAISLYPWYHMQRKQADSFSAQCLGWPDSWPAAKYTWPTAQVLLMQRGQLGSLIRPMIDVWLLMCSCNKE